MTCKILVNSTVGSLVDRRTESCMLGVAQPPSPEVECHDTMLAIRAGEQLWVGTDAKHERQLNIDSGPHDG